MAGAKQVRFDVLVGDGSNYLTSSTASAPHTQTDITGASKTIKWTMESLDLQACSSSAIISYERLNTASAVKNFRMALVNIRISYTSGDAFGAGETIFCGRVTGQNVTHDRVTLTCEGLDAIAGQAPALGVVRFRIKGTGASTNTVAVFNEHGAPDQRETPPTDVVNDDIGDGLATTWGTYDAAVAMAQRIHTIKGQVSEGETFLFDQIAQLDIGTSTDKARLDKTETKPVGLFDALQASAAEEGKVVVTLPDTSSTVTIGGQSFVAAMFPDAFDRFDQDNKKNITWNKYQTMAGGDLSGIPFPLQITHDNATPTKLVGYSGKRLVCTVLEIDPSNSTYVETTTDENGLPILKCHASGYQSTRTKIYTSTKDRWQVLGNGSKWNTVGGVQPRITNFSDIQSSATAGVILPPVFVNDQEIIYNFKTGTFPTSSVNSETCPYSTSSEIMVGGDKWELAKEWQDADDLDFIENVKVQFSQASLDVTISGFVENDDSAATGITIERFKAVVNKILLPVTITSDDREVALAEQVGRTGSIEGMFSVSDVTAASDTPGFTLDLCHHKHRYQFFDNVVPVSRVDDLGEWSDGMTAYIRVDGIEVDMQTILQKNTKNDLAQSIMNDGSSMDVTIPIELLPLVADNFPVYFGEWLDDISAQSGVFAGYELPRPLMVSQKSYSQTDVRIIYK